MKDFSKRLAVVTGGGSGIGRALVAQLAAERCDVAFCDISAEGMKETRDLALKGAPQGTRVTMHQADVAVKKDVEAFRDAVQKEHGRDHINLLFNNAGIGGGGSFIQDPPEMWERAFNICWNGVYLCSRAFMPMLLAADKGHIINTSSINGFWAALPGPVSHTAYSAAKFAVKGFSEALIKDLRLHAPHLGVSVVMPGHIGTGIVRNSLSILGVTSGELFGEDETPSFDADSFERDAPTSPAEAATVILNGVKEGRWRILIGDDAEELDKAVRSSPEDAYEDSFIENLQVAATMPSPEDS